MTRQILILGAGMVGVGVAWHLLGRGYNVTLIDRCQPGRETSYGNAGLIQREAVQPHPFPRHLSELWRVLPNNSIDVRYRLGAMFEEASPLWQYWRYSAPDSFARIVPEYASLIEHCTADHKTIFKAANAEHLIGYDGWLQVYRNLKRFEQDLLEAEKFRDRYGVQFRRIDQAKLQHMEPDLSKKAIGAIHWTNSWSVSDPGELVQAYADDFVAKGGNIQLALGESIEQLESGRWVLYTDIGSFEADDLVLATGPWSSTWLEQLGYKLPMFVQRGYHMHYYAQGNAKLNHAIMDIEKGYVLGPKQAGLRLTTGAELNTIDAPPRLGQLRAAEQAALELFPLGSWKEKEPWKGARPCMSDMKPVIGPAHLHENLWFAFGHGHQGFTLGPTTGRLLSQMVAGEPPTVDMQPFRTDRF